MIRYISHRLFLTIFLLLGISFISFLIMQLAPGSYLDTLALNPQISPAYVEHMKEKFGLNLPWYLQYWHWIRGILPHPAGSWSHWDYFDFGISFAQQVPVFQILKPAMFNTLVLATAAVVLSWVIAIPLGVYASVKQNGYFDQATVLFSYVGFAIPDFFLAMVFLVFAVQVRLVPLSSMAPTALGMALWLGLLGGFFTVRSDSASMQKWIQFLAGGIATSFVSLCLLLLLLFLCQKAKFPIGGMMSPDFDFLSPVNKVIDLAHHLFLPTLVLTIGNVAYLMRQMRASMLDVFKAEYVTTARAKGVSEGQVIRKHAFRNALNPMITVFGFELGFLLSGALAVEIVMSWPGLGRVIYEALIQKDLYVVMGDLMLSSFLLIVGNLLADILLAWADPRIKYG